MSVVNREGDLELGSDMRFERRWWKAERVLWGFLGLFLACGAAGLFGRGWLSKATTAPPGAGLEVRYERVTRSQTPALLEIRLGAAAIQSGRVRLHANADLLRRLGVQQTVPRPLAS